MKIPVLLVVDPQVDFCPGGSLAIEGGDEIFECINRLLVSDRFAARIATMDWHPENHISFVTQHPGQQVFAVVQSPHGRQQLYPPHCIAGSEGANLHPLLKADAIEKLILKGTDPKIDSYSGFFDNTRLHRTELVSYLTQVAQREGCSLDDLELTVAGLALDICVRATALDAAALGFKTQIILEGCRAVDQRPEALRALASELKQAGIELVSERELALSTSIARDRANATETVQVGRTRGRHQQ